MDSPAARTPRAIAFFDVDGTLVPGTSSGRFVASHLGHEEEAHEIERTWETGVVTVPSAAEQEARFWAGLSPDAVDGWLQGLPLVDGIADVVAWCQAHDVVPVVATLAWQPIGDHLCRRFGFAAASGVGLELRDGAFTGRPLADWDGRLKVIFAHEMSFRYGTPWASCIAVGDGFSDVELFGAVGHSVAFNASPVARAAASESVDSPDLRSLLPVLERWLDALPPQGQ